MSNESQKKIKNDPESDLEIDRMHANQSRRSFAKAGIIAPVIMSLANRPAWGGGQRCTVSGFDSLVEIGSGNRDDIICTYQTPDQLLATQNTTPPLEKIIDLFQCTPALGGSISSVTVIDALNNLGADNESQRRRLLTAAKLNANLVNNPFGGCPVDDVFCHFETDETIPFQFSSTQEWTQEEVFRFLRVVFGEETL